MHQIYVQGGRMDIQNEGPEAWQGHTDDDTRWGNPYRSKEDFLSSFNNQVLEEHPDFNKDILVKFQGFFDAWEKEVERLDQVSAQSAVRKLCKYLKL